VSFTAETEQKDPFLVKAFLYTSVSQHFVAHGPPLQKNHPRPFCYVGNLQTETTSRNCVVHRFYQAFKEQTMVH